MTATIEQTLTELSNQVILKKYATLYWTQFWGNQSAEHEAERKRDLSAMRTEILRRMEDRPVEPPPCPQCSGSGRAWVHDAAGGYGTTCSSCDGTGAK